MTSEPDFNAHIPGAPRAGCTAAGRGQALWDVMTVLAGRRALGSVHADETRGGMEEIEPLWALATDVVNMVSDHDGFVDIRCFRVDSDGDALGKRKDFVVYDSEDVCRIMYKHGIYPRNVAAPLAVEPFLKRSLTEIFPLGSPERNAIDEMYGEDSQSQWKDATS